MGKILGTLVLVLGFAVAYGILSTALGITSAKGHVGIVVIQLFLMIQGAVLWGRFKQHFNF